MPYLFHDMQCFCTYMRCFSYYKQWSLPPPPTRAFNALILTTLTSNHTPLGSLYISTSFKRHCNTVSALLLFWHSTETGRRLNPSIRPIIAKYHSTSLWLVSICQWKFGPFTLQTCQCILPFFLALTASWSTE